MKKRIILTIVPLFIILMICLLLIAPNKSSTEKALDKAMMGTWILVSMELPDGTLLKPPDISGLAITTRKYSSMNGIIPSGKGKFDIWVMGAKFDEMSDKSAKFKRILFASVSQGSGWEKIDPKPEDMEWKVEIIDNKVIIRPGDESESVIDGDIMTHTYSNGRKDIWKRVEKITSE